MKDGSFVLLLIVSFSRCVYNADGNFKCLCNTLDECPSIEGAPLAAEFDSTCKHCLQFCASRQLK